MWKSHPPLVMKWCRVCRVLCPLVRGKGFDESRCHLWQILFFENGLQITATIHGCIAFRAYGFLVEFNDFSRHALGVGDQGSKFIGQGMQLTAVLQLFASSVDFVTFPPGFGLMGIKYSETQLL